MTRLHFTKAGWTWHATIYISQWYKNQWICSDFSWSKFLVGEWVSGNPNTIQMLDIPYKIVCMCMLKSVSEYRSGYDIDQFTIKINADQCLTILDRYHETYHQLIRIDLYWCTDRSPLMMCCCWFAVFILCFFSVWQMSWIWTDCIWNTLIYSECYSPGIWIPLEKAIQI